MRKAHNIILKAVSTILLESGRLLDLGCGNGVLLERITKEASYLVPYGVEAESERYWKAVERVGENVKWCDIFSTDAYLHDNFELTLIALNRFAEVTEDKADMFLRHLRNHTKFLIVYSYEEWKGELDSLIYRHFTYASMDQDEATEVRILRPRV